MKIGEIFAFHYLSDTRLTVPAQSNMLLLNDPEDPPTFFSQRWISTSTPDLAFAAEDLSRKTSRKVLSQLAGSDHRPVLLAINLQYRPSNPKTFPRWNYKKADWEMFSRLTNEYYLSVYLSRSLADRWGTTVDFTTSFLHSSLFSAFRSMMFHSRPVHSLMLSSHRFLCLPLRLPP